MGPDAVSNEVNDLMSPISIGEESDFPRKLGINMVMKSVFQSSIESHNHLYCPHPVPSNVPSICFSK